MYNLYKEIIDWHLKTFPKMGAFRQWLKLMEEVIEYIFSRFNLEEYADICIVLVVLQYRYKSKLAAFILKKYVKGIEGKLYKAIQSKMKVNKIRNWNKAWVGHHKAK